MPSEIQQYDRGLGNGPIDRKLLAAAADGLSPLEMSRAVNGKIPPEQCAQRVRDILESRNWLTYFEQEQLTLESINEILANLRQWTTVGSLDHIKVALSALKMKLDVVSKNKISPEEAANIIREGQGRIMLAAIQAAMITAAEELGRRYPEVPVEEVHDVFLMALPGAVDVVERRIEQK